MDAGDWIALVAIVVSVAAAVVSTHQARTAKAQADAAKEANALTRQQMDREEQRHREAVAEAEAAALREAEKVALALSASGGSVVVSVTNHGRMPITDVELLSVGAGEGEDGPWVSWSVNRNIGRGPLSQVKRTILHSGEEMEVATWLLNEHSQQVRPLPRSCSALIRFRDHEGQWWHRASGDGPPTRTDEPAA